MKCIRGLLFVPFMVAIALPVFDASAESLRVPGDLMEASAAKTCVGVFAGFVGLNGSRSNGDEYIGVTDGTKAGTRKIMDVWPGVRSTIETERPDHMTSVLGSKVFFTSDSSVFGRELFITDGRSARIVKDIAPGITASSPRPLDKSYPTLSSSRGKFDSAGKWILFTVTGDDLWQSDGTFSGTLNIFDSNYPEKMRDWVALASNGQSIILSSKEQKDTAVVWISYGSHSSMTRLLSIEGVKAPKFAQSASIDGGRYVFAVGSDLYYTNGTAAGTKKFMTFPYSIVTSSFYAIKGKSVALFRAWHPKNGAVLFRTDGTVAGTYQLPIKNADRNTGPYNLKQNGNYAYFFQPTLPGGNQTIWRTDGTRAGTRLVLNADKFKEMFLYEYFFYNGQMVLVSWMFEHWRLNVENNSIVRVSVPDASRFIVETSRGYIVSDLGTLSLLDRKWKYTLLYKNRVTQLPSADTICR